MIFLVLVLFGVQTLCPWAASRPAGEGPAELLSPRCDGRAAEGAADLALHHINAHRREGYILRLYRIFSVREQPQEITGSVFYLILDVIDTECHVLSRKPWRDCPARPAHSAVYGQCKAIIYINQARNITHLNTYECTLQRVPPRSVTRLCPDCPIDDCPTEPKYLEAAAQSLAKFNQQSEQTHYFSVLNVTRASMQWVDGPAYFVEFLIQETSCPKTDVIADISKCKPLASETAQMGFCKGSTARSDLEQEHLTFLFKNYVTVSCEIYSPQDPATEEGDQPATLTSETPSHGHQEALPSETNPFSPHLEKTVGWVKILPPSTEDMSSQHLPEGQNQYEDGNPIPPEAVGATPSLDGKKTPVDKADLTKPVTGPVILPFPEEFSLSDSCPGEAKERNFIIQPLLPKKPTKA